MKRPRLSVFFALLICVFLPMILQARPNLSQETTNEYEAMFPAGKGKFLVLRDTKETDTFYYIPSKFTLANLIEKKTKKALPAISLEFINFGKSDAAEDYAQLQCTFELFSPPSALEQLKKDIKAQTKLDIAQIKLLQMPISGANATFYLPSGDRLGKKDCYTNTNIYGKPESQFLSGNLQLTKSQAELVLKTPVTAVLELLFDGTMPGLPMTLTFDPDLALKALASRPELKKAWLDAVINADAKAGATFRELFLTTKAVTIENTSDTQVKPEQLDLFLPAFLYPFLYPIFPPFLPEKLDSNRMQQWETDPGKTYAQCVELALPNPSNGTLGGVLTIDCEGQFGSEQLWIGTGKFDASAFPKNIVDQIVTTNNVVGSPHSYIFLPGMNLDPMLGLKSVTIEFTAIDDKKVKIAGPITAKFTDQKQTWVNAKGEEIEAVDLDFSKNIEKIRNQLEKCSIQLRIDLVQAPFGRTEKLTITRSIPLLFGDIPLSTPLEYFQLLTINTDFLTFGDLTGVSGTINCPAPRRIFKFELAANYKFRNTGLFLEKSVDGKNGPIDVSLQFTLKKGKKIMTIKDLLKENPSGDIVLIDEDWQ